jgi:ribonucleotide monophosphatase NagD (HAD superfamily)
MNTLLFDMDGVLYEGELATTILTQGALRRGSF